MGARFGARGGAHRAPEPQEGRWDPDRSQLRWVGRFETRWGPLGTGLVGLVGCGGALAAVGVIAWRSGLPWVFPSLGPTALLVFESPLRPQASPRHTLVGHGVAIVVGYACLVAFGLTSTPAATVSGFSPARVGAASLAVAMTTLLLHVLRSAHPPAGATTLIVSLGILRTVADLAVIAGAVLVVTVLGWTFNRAAGIAVPVWSPRGRGRPAS